MKINKSTYRSPLDFRILGIRLPLTMDLCEWGHQFYSQESENIVWIKKRNTNSIYKIIKSNLYNKVELIQADKGEDNIIISFIDTRNENETLNTFTRIVVLPYIKTYKIENGFKIKCYFK